MSSTSILLALFALVVFGYFFGSKRATHTGRQSALHSRPHYYGYFVALWVAVPTLMLLLFWNSISGLVIEQRVISSMPAEFSTMDDANRSLLLNEIKSSVEDGEIITGDDAKSTAAKTMRALQQRSQNYKAILILIIGLIAFALSLQQIHAKLQARNWVEQAMRWGMIACALIAVLTTIGIVVSILFEALQFFAEQSVFEFVFGTHWSVQTAIREDQVGASGTFGAVPLFVGTLLISLIALVVAVPLGLMSAIYLAEYADKRVSAIAKPILEVLAGIPTVVYGFFAAITVAPAVKRIADSFGVNASHESALAAGFVMGVMLIPFVSSLSEDVISAVPQSLRDGSFGMGATKSETIKQVVLPAALPGIVGSILLAASRAIGETMIVVMAAGAAANLTFNPLDAVTTVTVQIKTILTGDQDFDSVKTLAAFALGLALFIVTLLLNYLSLKIVRKYREQYD